MPTSSKWIFGLIAGRLLLVISAVLIQYFVVEKSENNVLEKRPAIGGVFTLTNPEGQPVPSQTWQDGYQLLYFGFTYCPAICPTELQKMTAVLDGLSPEVRKQVAPVFISVDPERDTPAVMGEYIANFHPEFLALTGSVEDIEQVKSLYHVYAAKVDDPSLSEYTVDHSSYIYFISPQGRLIELFTIEDPASAIIQAVQAELAPDV